GSGDARREARFAAAGRPAEDPSRQAPREPPERSHVIAAGRLAIVGTLGLALVVNQRAPTPKAPARFVDVTAAAKIAFVPAARASPEKRMVETFGSGVAWIDYDNEGFQDLYFVN